MENAVTVKQGTFTFDCPEECGAAFTLPVTVISTEPASSGQIVFTVRMNANNDAGERYKSHMLAHYLNLGLIDEA